MFYSELGDERADLVAQGIKLAKEKTEYEARRKQFLAYQNEVNNLIEQQRELLQVLPRKDDIEQFLENVNSQIELAGLSHVSSVREPPVSEELYARLPIKMAARGTFHQLTRFFRNIGELKRIVTVSNLQLKHADVRPQEKELAGGELLQAEFTATTYQLLERPAPVRPPGGKS